MKSKYTDLVSIIQVLGGIYSNPQLLDNTDKYHLLADDFPEAFHYVRCKADHTFRSRRLS